MPGEYTAIADVGESLVALLRDRMSDLVDDNEVVLASPGDVESRSSVRLTVFLYRVAESAHLRNKKRTPEDSETLRDPPIALDLYYLLTAYPSTGNDDQTTRTLAQHTVLGRAVRELRDSSILRGSDLKRSLAGEESIHVSMTPLEDDMLEQLVSIWTTFPDRPFRPSVSYVVSPVLVESERVAATSRVRERELEKYVRSEPVRQEPPGEVTTEESPDGE